MRRCRQARTNSNDSSNLQGTTPFTRRFEPAALDLDDLAEAIRLLLDQEAPPPADRQPEIHLLSSPQRGTHVVEAPARP